MACDPTCTSPITGISIPTYQSHPTSRHGHRRQVIKTASEITAKTNADNATRSTASPARG